MSLFSGIGGFDEGFKRVGVKFNWHGFSEIDEKATAVFKKHFPEAVELGSVTTIDPRKLPKLDLITFGFPCQDLSIAGKRKGLKKGSRSSLFFEAMRIIRINRPKYFIFENVMGLLSKTPARDIFEKREWLLVILREITDVGYDCQWQILNTSWVLPQNRERIYAIGHIRKNRRPEIFPIGESDCGNIKSLGGNLIETATDRQTDR